MNAVTNVIDKIKTEVERVFEAHAGEAQTMLADAASVVSNPVIDAIAGLEHIPASWLTGFANGLLDLDHELGRIKAAIAQQTALLAPTPDPSPAPPAGDAGPASPPADATSSASAASAADGPAPLLVSSPEAQANAPA